MMKFTWMALATAALIGPASAQALDPAAGKPVAELLNDGYVIASTTSNARTGDIVLVVQKDKKHFVCVLTEIRGSGYTDPKPKPIANPCIPLN